MAIAISGVQPIRGKNERTNTRFRNLAWELRTSKPLNYEIAEFRERANVASQIAGVIFPVPACVRVYVEAFPTAHGMQRWVLAGGQRGTIEK